MFFIVGFLMAAAGFAMLVQGQFPLGKHQVKSRPARVAGGIWVSYLPLAFGASLLLDQLELKEIIDAAVIYGILLAIWLLTGTIIVLRSAYGGSGRRSRTLATAGSRNLFEPVGPAAMAEQGLPPGPGDFFSSPPPPPAPSASKKPGRRPAPPQKNPFDFS